MKNKNLRNVDISLFIVIIPLSILIHELGHGIVGLILGNTWGGISVSSSGFNSLVRFKNEYSTPFVFMAGSIISLVFNCFIIHISFRNELISTPIMVFSMIFSEIFYIGVSPIIETGDFYHVLMAFNIELESIVFITFLIISLSLLLISFFIIYIRNYDL